MSFTLGGVDLDDEDSIEIVNDEHSPVKYLNAQQNQNKTKQQNKLKTKEEHPNKESTKLDLIYTLDQDDEPMHSTRSLKSLRTYGRSKTSNRTSHTTQHNNHNNNHRNKDNNNHNTNSTSDGDTNHTKTTVPITHDDPTPHTRHKRARSPDTDTAVTPVKKFRADEAQSFLEKVTERFRAPQTVITMPNKVTVSSEEKKRNNKRVSRDSTDRTKQPAKLGKDGSVFRAGSATQPLAVSDDVTPVKRAPVKHKSRATDQSRDEDSVEVVILNDESPQREIESPSHAFLDMTRDEHEKNSDEKNSDESSSSLDQSFDLFDSQPLTASRDSKIGALPRLALVCLQIDRMVVRDTDVKDAFQLRVKAHHLSVSEVSPSSPPIEIAISELVQVQYSALHRLIVLRLKTVPVSLSGFWQNKSKDRPYLVLILAEELSDEHKRHLQSLLSTEQRRLDKYDDRKLKIDLVTEVYEQYIKGRQQGVDLTLSSDHVPLEIRGEIHHSDEARDDTEYHARDSDSPPRSTRILRSSRASVQSAEEIHAEIEHKRANVLCVWPKGARDSVSITELDLARLEPNEFLNDVIIDFYLMWIRDRIVPPKQRNKIYFYNSFFYNLLTRKSQGYNKVKKWTKHVNIFDYDYLVIPINQHFHWRVCIVYHPQRLLSTSTSDDAPYLIMLDSLQGSAGSVYRAIKEYLQKEWQDKQHDSDVTLDMTRLKTVMPKAPTQDNHYDCGIFVLQYVESFCINPVSSPMHITESWFSAKVIARKRREIRAIILKLAEEQGHSIGSTANINHSNNDNTQD